MHVSVHYALVVSSFDDIEGDPSLLRRIRRSDIVDNVDTPRGDVERGRDICAKPAFKVTKVHTLV